MKRIRALKKSALVVDVLLVAGALIAILGLANYVRLKATNKPDQSKRTEDLAYTLQKFDLITEDASAAGVPDDQKQGAGTSGDAAAVLDAHTSQPATGSAPTQPSPTDTRPSTGPGTRSKCDRTRYDAVTLLYKNDLRQIEDELNRLKSLSKLTRELQALYNILDRKKAALTNDYDNHPDVINCLLDM